MAAASRLVHVDLAERSYDIQIGTGTLPDSGPLIVAATDVTHAVIVTDEHVEQPHAIAVAESLTGADVAVDLVVVPAGEATKSIDIVAGLWEKLLALHTDRKSVIVAVGGGVIGDLAGFAAATFARGLAFAQVPTTLLAQVDSSVGGKVGINLTAAKNMVGSFWQPRIVLIDTAVLDTLPEREYRSGLAEVVKYGVILDPNFFTYLEANVAALKNRQADVLETVVERCCRLKADVVELDEREETGARAVLNYGHTFCHALEAITGYGTYLHGEAVSIGMLCASRLAEKLGRIDRQVTWRQRDLLAALDLPVDMPPVDHEKFLAAMMKDKKVEHGHLHFVLPTKLGHVERVANVDVADVRAVLGKTNDAPI